MNRFWADVYFQVFRPTIHRFQPKGRGEWTIPTLPCGLTFAISGTFPPTLLKSSMQNSTSDLNVKEKNKIKQSSANFYDMLVGVF